VSGRPVAKTSSYKKFKHELLFVVLEPNMLVDGETTTTGFSTGPTLLDRLFDFVGHVA
jgi:hypothetical protein